MRAAWYEKTGPAGVLNVGELPDPIAGEGEVLVRVHASGVNPADTKMRAGVRGPVLFPKVIPHADGGGVIQSVGDGVDRRRIGERVWLWNAAWQRPFGSCAEYICLPSRQAVRLPDHVGFEAASCLGTPASTACQAVFCDGPVAGRTILVTGGAGAVGHYAIQFARWGGAFVVATVSGPEKAARAEAAGAHHVVNYRDPMAAAAIMDATGGRGVHRIIEVEFGANIEVSNAVLKQNGTIVTYGSMADPNPRLPFYSLMFKGANIRMIAVYVLSQAAREIVIDHVDRAISEGALSHAIAASYSLDDVVAAHQLVESGRAVGNVVVTLD